MTSTNDLTPPVFDGSADYETPAPVRLRDIAADTPPAEEAEPGLPADNMRVTLEDGTTFSVRTTNKDYLRWDKTPPARRGGVKNFQDAPFLFATFLAWSAATRTGKTNLGFDGFADAVDEVERFEETVPPTR